jgi:hypothetical protein
MIINNALNIIPALSLCFPSDIYFDSFFERIFKNLIHFLIESKYKATVTPFAIEVIGETINNIKHCEAMKAHILFKYLYEYLESTDINIKMKSISTIGIIITHSNDCLQQYHTKIIGTILRMSKVESDFQCLNNICITLCRLVLCFISDENDDVEYELVIIFSF